MTAVDRERTARHGAIFGTMKETFHVMASAEGEFAVRAIWQNGTASTISPFHTEAAALAFIETMSRDEDAGQRAQFPSRSRHT
jgi:hypothetical protein